MSGDRHRAERVLELGGAVVSVLDRLDREDVRLLPLRRVIASAVGLRWVRRQHSPLVAMHHMILCARRKIFEITTKPNIPPLFMGWLGHSASYHWRSPSGEALLPCHP